MPALGERLPSQQRITKTQERKKKKNSEGIQGTRKRGSDYDVTHGVGDYSVCDYSLDDGKKSKSKIGNGNCGRGLIRSHLGVLGNVTLYLRADAPDPTDT